LKLSTFYANSVTSLGSSCWFDTYYDPTDISLLVF